MGNRPLKEVHFYGAAWAGEGEDEHWVGAGIGVEPVEGGRGNTCAKRGVGGSVPKTPEVFDFGGGKGAEFFKVQVRGESFDPWWGGEGGGCWPGWRNDSLVRDGGLFGFEKLLREGWEGGVVFDFFNFGLVFFTEVGVC